ncbi:MAG: amidohydrolase family protein [Acidobacteriaceae bacterium]
MEITANLPDRGLTQIQIHEGRIASVRALGPADPKIPFVSPGFVDIQLNGFNGVNFSDPELDPEKAISILPAVWQTGVTSFCPTLITNTLEILRRNFRILETARAQNPRFRQTAPGYHLEGPYLSPGGAHGAHDPTLMRHPNWDEFMSLQEAAGGNISMITLAPELPGALEFIRKACAAGVIVALGHTDATPEQIHRAVEAGASLVTHFGNGCPEFIPRHRNPLWAQLACDELSTSLICDGFHLPPDLIRVVFRVKGPERCILITDAIHVAGLDPGPYTLVGQKIELLPSGQVVMQDRKSMAGSALHMNKAVAFFAESSGASLAEAIQAATTNPGRLLQQDEVCSDLLSGQWANLVLFRTEQEALRIETVLLRGEAVYTSG